MKMLVSVYGRLRVLLMCMWIVTGLKFKKRYDMQTLKKRAHLLHFKRSSDLSPLVLQVVVIIYHQVICLVVCPLYDKKQNYDVNQGRKVKS